jgi:exonuclease SbcD
VLIVHTSDWHAGRLWKGIDRLSELEAVLEGLGNFIERERVDLLLMSGDVFDSRGPSAAAERAVFRFFRRVGKAGTKTVVIAGNHDHPARLEAWGTLAELVDVATVARPRPANRGGVIEFAVRSGELAVIAAIPFARTSDLVSALELAADDTLAHQRYAEQMRAIVEQLANRFRPGAVNLLMAHTHLDPALLAGSERQVHLGEEWTITAQSLPSTAHYVALGHIHRPQRIEAAPAPAYYAGSPLQLDFGEVGEEKSFVVIRAEPGRPAGIERVPYAGGKTLSDIRMTLAELEREADRLRGSGWLRVRVPLEAADFDLNRKVRQLLGSAVVSVDYELPARKDRTAEPSRSGLGPSDLFALYYRRHHDMIGGGPFGLKPGEWTDDTSMALCLAESLLACGRLDQLDLMQRFVRWWRDGESSCNDRCFDIGVATRTALARFLRTGNPAAGSTDPRTAGNGSIMRLAPLVLRWHREPTKAIAAANRASRPMRLRRRSRDARSWPKYCSTRSRRATKRALFGLVERQIPWSMPSPKDLGVVGTAHQSSRAAMSSIPWRRRCGR